MSRSLEGKIRIGVAIIVAVLIVNASLSYRATRTLIANEQWVSHTYKVLNQLEVILSTLKDAEGGERGFIVTGLKEYLEPYESATRQIDPQLQELKEMTA